MAAAAPAGILYPAAAVRPPAFSILHPAEAARPPAISFSRLPSRRAHLRAVVLSRPASPVLRCAPSGDSALSGDSACVAQDEDYVLYVVEPPPWVPSEAECKKFLELDMSLSAIRERFRRESVEARAAVVGAVVDVLRPLWDNFRDLRNLEYVHDTEEFQIGMLFGALMTCIGMYQLWNFAPNVCLDIAMSYAFYKLSVLAADVRRRGFSPDLIIRIKLAVAAAMYMKDQHLKSTPLDRYIRTPVYFIYFLSVSWDFIGKKKMAKYAIPAVIYGVVTLFQKPKLMKIKIPKNSSGSGEKSDGELVQCVHEPENPSGEKEDGQILQLVSEPNDSSSAKQGGEAPQSVSAPDNHLNITVQEDGEAPQSVSAPDNHLNIIVQQDGEAPQSVSAPDNLLNITVHQDGEAPQSVSALDNHLNITVQQDGEAPQSVSAPDNHLDITVQQEREPLQLFDSEPENL